MNELLLGLGLERLKPFLTALVLPPVPIVLFGLAAALLVRRRWVVGRGLTGLSFILLWLNGCIGMADLLGSATLPIPPPLDAIRLEALRKEAGSAVAIIVLGAGVEEWAPEYQTSSLQYRSLERLRYGLWLGRKIGWPVGFSGGVGWAQPNGAAREAAVAQRIATEEFDQPLKWVEDASRDTRENAELTAAMLRRDGVRHVLLVTHGSHMPRSERNFKRAGSAFFQIEPAPMALATKTEWPLLRWVPTGEGFLQVRTVLREALGMASGA